MEKDERGYIDYELLYKIEDKHGGLHNCPEDNDELWELRNKLGVYRRSEVYNWEKVLDMMSEANVSITDVGKKMGKGKYWDRSLANSREITIEHMLVFSDYFEIPVRELMR